MEKTLRHSLENLQIPVNGVNGNIFHTKDAFVEIDTADVYFFDEDTNSWILPS